MIDSSEFIEKILAYNPKADVEALKRAYKFSAQVHQSQVRESGEPYFSHPLAVALILIDMRLDTATVITALLHDTVEDTHVTLSDIKHLFGTEVAELVSGVTKLSKVKLQSEKSKPSKNFNRDEIAELVSDASTFTTQESQSEKTKQAENFRKFVLAISNDLRVLLVKLADRLHNMQTLCHVKDADKRKRISRETLEIYAPLAQRIGMHHFKDELEDIAFQELHPDAKESIHNRLDYIQNVNNRNAVKAIIDELKQILSDANMNVEISGRIKSPYSIWRKTCCRNISIEQLSDIMAFRIVVSSVAECYHALGILHGRYPVISGRFKDYISTPKPNNYRSLHTTLVGPHNHKVEIQIRTREMHDIAEYGLAAHWQYKQGVQSQRKEKQDYKWLKSLLEILEHASNPEEFLEHTKLEMFSDQVFLFTKGGDLISLPRGATPIDFAYAIHSKVGNKCVGVKINNRMMPLRTVLNNGDQVEILTNDLQSPSPIWERFIVTGKARAHIRKHVRHKKQEQYISLGNSIISKVFSQEGLKHSKNILNEHLVEFKVSKLDDLYAAVGEGRIPINDVIRIYYPNHDIKYCKGMSHSLNAIKHMPHADTNICIKGLIPGMAVHYAHCCHPLPGDKIVGIVLIGRGVNIHTYDCDELNNYLSEPDRWIDVNWDAPKSEQERFTGRLQVMILNQPGALAALTGTISKQAGNIVNLKIVNRSNDFFDVLNDIEVKNTDHLENIAAALRISPFVRSVERPKH